MAAVATTRQTKRRRRGATVGEADDMVPSLYRALPREEIQADTCYELGILAHRRRQF